ncbi:MAG: CotH kinase family protein [Ruminiclostridium sp.]
MSTSKWIDKICIIGLVLSLIVTFLFINGEALGLEKTSSSPAYESRLFDTSRVHTIDIVMDDWDGFIETCENEEYALCAAVIDGEAFRNIAIRAKGNTSLSTVSQMNSSRYSFKIEFDHYDSTRTYYGLDKLCLNNIIQDNTYMKDYLAYTLMAEMGADAPLCSYAYITVNGEDWGLYLAVEGVEEAFLSRNYGSDYGELYKPDSMNFGGGRGNGKGFDMGNFMDAEGGESGETNETANSSDNAEKPVSTAEQSEMPQNGQNNSFTPPDMPQNGDNNGFTPTDMPQNGGNNGFSPTDMPQNGGNSGFTPSDMPQNGGNNGFTPTDRQNGFGGMGGDKGGMGGKGSDDVKLIYSDDNPESYKNIFDSAKTDITESDKQRLIASLKALNENENIESAVDTDEVIRYFAVHNFLCNGDSYTGSMIHNYYLYEEDGKLSMIPWDYNLAFGTFNGGNAKSQVNSPIDSPVSGGMSDRPMVSWIFSSEEYTEIYHARLSELIENRDFEALIDRTAALISPYVEKDPTKFCTYDEFEKGVAAIKEFCILRAESIKGQLSGAIPSTEEGQSADSSALVDTGSLNLSDMGNMSAGGAGGFGGKGDFADRENFRDRQKQETANTTE